MTRGLAGSKVTRAAKAFRFLLCSFSSPVVAPVSAPPKANAHDGDVGKLPWFGLPRSLPSR